ncbi:hypothetical protein Dsin_005472 [Dipteronia sinensis]|uniref:Uncharacterized protein n=1 Tax=Dipteronia sinensis TaxID=43782 RepID=A0AAE0EGJ0_9ROSI|nr:hypothetical protein Dsin_005472 [Dipteronia sinensis]
MEEEKSVAYYDELTSKGGRAARFKQGHGLLHLREREKDYRHRDRDRERDRDRDRGRDYRDRDRDRERRREEKRSESGKSRKEMSDKVDFSRLIEGCDLMTPAERVKAKMKLQLAETGVSTVRGRWCCLGNLRFSAGP